MDWRRFLRLESKFRVSIPVPRGRDRSVSIDLTEGTAFAVVCVALAGLVAVLTDVGGGADLSYFSTPRAGESRSSYLR
jgi:hypothetical protein